MNVLVVTYHPDAASAFTGATIDRVRRGLASSGRHHVRVVDVQAEPTTPPGAEDDVRWCDTLVLVYPTWWSGQPAKLAEWLDRVLVDAVSAPSVGGRWRRPLRNVRRLAVVTSHGSSKLVNALQGEGGKRVVTRAVRGLCHPLARTSWIALYGIDRSSADRRSRFLERVERRFRSW